MTNLNYLAINLVLLVSSPPKIILVQKNSFPKNKKQLFLLQSSVLKCSSEAHDMQNLHGKLWKWPSEGSTSKTLFRGWMPPVGRRGPRGCRPRAPMGPTNGSHICPLKTRKFWWLRDVFFDQLRANVNHHSRDQKSDQKNDQKKHTRNRDPLVDLRVPRRAPPNPGPIGAWRGPAGPPSRQGKHPWRQHFTILTQSFGVSPGRN